MALGEVEQRLAAILAADVAGYSRLMGADERATIATLREFREVFRDRIEANGGRVVDMAGDSVLAIFPTAIGAVRAATEAQGELAKRNEALPEDRRMLFRVGLNLGDIQEADDDGSIYGDGVNVAARLEAMAEPGGINVSGSVFDSVRSKLGVSFSFLGEHAVKNIAEPVRAYRVGEGSAPARRHRGQAVRRWSAVAATLGIVALAAAWLLVGRDAADDPSGTAMVEIPTPPTDRPSIAVLPFVNLSGDPEDQYFSDGIARDIVTDLAKISGLFVISPNSSFAFRDLGGDGGKAFRETVRAASISGELKVRYLVQGNLRRADETVRINVQLVDGQTGDYIWADRFDRDIEDIFAVQDEITSQIISALKVELTAPEERRIADRYTADVEAYDLYLRARSLHGDTTAERNKEARRLLERAIERDPGFAAAYAELSLIHLASYYFHWSDTPDPTKQLGLDMARKAVELNPELAEARTRLAWARVWMGDVDGAVEEGRRAIAMDPGFADGYLYLSHILVYAGLPEEGIRVARQGMPLDPLMHFHYLFHIADGLWMLERRDEAVEHFRQAIQLNPDAVVVYMWLTALYGELGRIEEARDMASEMLRRSPDFSLEAARSRLGYKDSAFADRLIDGLRKAGLGAADDGA